MTQGSMIAGYSTSPNTGRNTIDYITIASTGDAQDFGDLTAYTQSWQGGAGSNKIRGAHGIGRIIILQEIMSLTLLLSQPQEMHRFGDALTNQRSQIPCATSGHGGLS